MGCFPCFDSRQEVKLNPEKETDDRRQKQAPPSMTSSSTNSRLPSGQLESMMRILLYY